MARQKSNTPREVRNTFYLTLIVVSAVLVAGVWIARVIDIRQSGTVHALPVTGKIVARSVAKVIEARFDGARLGILLAPPKGKAPSAGGAAPPLSPEQESLLRILKNPAARQEPGTPGQTDNAAVETTPQAFIIDRVEAGRNDLVQRLAALVPLAGLGLLEKPCKDAKTPCLRGDRDADRQTIQDAVVRGMVESRVQDAAKAWVDDVTSDVSVAKAWQRLELPGTARGFLLQALAHGPITEPVDERAIAEQLRDAVARQLAIDLAFATLPAAEAEWAARDIAARLAWGTAAVIFIGLWAAMVSLAVHQIWEFTASWEAVAGGIGASLAAGLLVALAQYSYQSSFELLGPLLRLLEQERKTEIAQASHVLNALAAVSLVLLIGAARAVLRRSPQTQPQDGQQPVVATDLARRVDAFRTIFNAGAVLLAAGVLEVSALYSWPASVFDGAAQPPENLKTVALLAGGYVGAVFTTVLLLVYLPTVSVLRQWITSELPADDAKQLLDGAGLNDTTSQQFLRLLQASAPLLAGLPLTGLLSLLN